MALEVRRIVTGHDSQGKACSNLMAQPRVGNQLFWRWGPMKSVASAKKAGKAFQPDPQ